MNITCISLSLIVFEGREGPGVHHEERSGRGPQDERIRSTWQHCTHDYMHVYKYVCI